MHHHHIDNARLMQMAAYLQAMQAGAQAHRYPIEGADQVGAMGAWGGFDILGGGAGRGDVGSAGLLDIVGASMAPGVATFAKPQNVAHLAQLAAAQAVSPEALMDASAVLQRPLGLPPNATFVADGPRVARKQYVGLGERIPLSANQSATITAQPQSVARIERLLIESVGSATASGRDFVVTRLDVGDMRQISGVGEIPGLAFSSEGFDLGVKLDTSNPGNLITISVTNLLTTAITLALVGIGTVVR